MSHVSHNRYLVKGSTIELEDFNKFLKINYPEFISIPLGSGVIINGGDETIWNDIKLIFPTLKYTPDVIVPIQDMEEQYNEENEEENGIYVDHSLHLVVGHSYDLPAFIQFISDTYPEFKVSSIRYFKLSTYQLWKEWIWSFFSDNIETHNIMVTGGNEKIWKEIETLFPKLECIADVLIPCSGCGGALA